MIIKSPVKPGLILHFRVRINTSFPPVFTPRTVISVRELLITPWFKAGLEQVSTFRHILDVAGFLRVSVRFCALHRGNRRG